ncbi:bacterial regulatory s, gntR family protein, partial [Vibrio parahaemolyticus V-223/04]
WLNRQHFTERFKR